MRNRGLFKVGDVVECVRNDLDPLGAEIEVGRIYTIEFFGVEGNTAEYWDCVKVNSYGGWVNPDCFVSTMPWDLIDLYYENKI